MCVCFTKEKSDLLWRVIDLKRTNFLPAKNSVGAQEHPFFSNLSEMGLLTKEMRKLRRRMRNILSVSVSVCVVRCCEEEKGMLVVRRKAGRKSHSSWRTQRTSSSL